MADHAKPELTYEPDLTGLLIVDPYNDFLAEGGKSRHATNSSLIGHLIKGNLWDVKAN